MAVIPQCANYNDDGTCHYCEAGFQVAADNARVCVPELPHCTALLASGDCQVCAPTYVLVTAQPSPDTCVPYIPHCDTYD